MRNSRGAAPAPSRTRSYATGAWLDMTTVPLMIEPSHLLEILRPFKRLALAHVPEAPEGKHPVCVDLWRVRGGRPDTRGIDQHTWSEMAGTATGAWAAGPVGMLMGAGVGALSGATAGGLTGAWLGPAGWLWGATAGWMAGAAMGATSGATAGATYGASAGGQAARGMSEMTSQTIGTYHEVMVSIPHVVERNGADKPHLFVVGMHSDSPVSLWTQQAFGFGFNKELASISCEPFRSVDVRNRAGELLISVTLVPADPEAWRPARDQPEIATVRRWLSQPLLGHVGTRLITSYLDRFYDDSSVLTAPATGQLVATRGFGGGVPPGEYEIRPSAPAHVAGAFQAAGVPVRLTYPEPLGA
jgi:hypothetical protein